MIIILRKVIPIIFLNGFLFFRNCFCSEITKPNVAIIGAGIGGASTSHFLTKLFDKNLKIDIFESKTIGGRLATVKLGNNDFEAGGAIIHPRNIYMKYFVKLLNLHSKTPVPDDTFGIWNGKEFIFKESNWKVITLLKLIFRYGLQPIYLYRYVGSILNDFDNIYNLQEQGIGYENVTALISAMNENLINLMQVSIKDHLQSLGYGEQLINELVKATLVVNYGQDTNVQAFVACVSIAGAGFDLWSIKGGNKEVPSRLISNNEIVSIIYSTVNRIDRLQTEDMPKYEIFYKENGTESITSKVYDIVIIAAPMTSDQESLVTFNGFKSSDVQFLGNYQTTYATFVAGKVNFSYFGSKETFSGIISCNPVDTVISSIGKLTSVNGKRDKGVQVWKVFSRQKLNSTIINKMFSKVHKVKEIKWKAYPQYSSAMRFDKFKVDDFMYYVNAIEWAASAMEMSAISGRNAAILAFTDYKRYLSDRKLTTEDQTHSSEL
ncbi:PREDICTED: prenylcysteine oxidase-like [Ceratosolen solmsi marchali]|uniref:Prenylcysteine oxidase-like n=1 Tax=Ceratosolen solmsi marchali TaxID=326594 RepID=A0AAJ6YNF3_9HYME|nr:PREDICTED: prenylcysteine oxidase-like [Ceratosolen solmsi marchali]